MLIEWKETLPLSLWALYLLMIPLIGLLLRKLALARAAKRGMLALDQITAKNPPGSAKPKVCVQLPVFNEPTQVQGLLEAVARLDWPDDHLEVQVLDDSTDETPKIVDEALARIRLDRPNLNIRHIRRPNRQGFKAGALNAGLAFSQADHFAIFDADFRPQPDFLVRLVPRLEAHPNAAFIQAMWSYVNDAENAFARCQSILLNIHFYIEHAGRYHSGYPFNFNGTAGIWRRQALEDLGGWSDHSVTEDLFLSYCAQLRGWQALLAPDIRCDSLLPDDLPSFLVQQRRWAKGSGQVTRMLAGQILRARSWPVRLRCDALLHLFGYALTTFVPLIFILGFVWIPDRGAWLESTHWFEPVRLLDGGFWLALWGLILRIYASPQAHLSRQNVPLFSRMTRTLFLMGISPLLSILLIPSFWRGLLLWRRSGELVFNRTPKRTERRSLGAVDHALCLAAIGTFAALGWQALQAELYLLAALLGAHLSCCAWLWNAMGRPVAWLQSALMTSSPAESVSPSAEAG